MAGAPAVRARRPKDRKQQILRVAAERFRRVGYHNVRMAEIAEATGITAGALYRHFSGKRELLAACTEDSMDRLAELVRAPGELADLLGAVAGFAVEHRALGVLWQREARHLAEERRRELRHGLRDAAAALAERITLARPSLSTSDAELLAWCVFAVLASPAQHTVELEPSRFGDLLAGLSGAVVAADLPPAGAARSSPSGNGLARTSRREMLLTAAIRLFSEQGYQSVSMAEVGAAAGISGPSVYNHFANKSELLVAALRRANETLQLALSDALARAETAESALHAVLDSYVGLTLSHSDLIGTLITELVNLPGEQRHELRRVQHEYLAEWVNLLRTTHPALPEPDARVMVHAAITLINDVARIHHLRTRPALSTELAHLARTLLATPRR
ncbi:TetR/AcrR family transcriptional regulator [Amycolatopsis nigrescens]|uniref:TetR/AcrR family transcriptional regulator n=1 Tax=Amycolatopsis nigrescens TaxID=381445 RepID=UPI000375AF38|nr:TetR/AcrR family transcriptional regulator [Amycolatopsis nigrescens]